jgi:hypothetical protein
MKNLIFWLKSERPRGHGPALWGIIITIGVVFSSPLWSKEAEEYKLPDRLGPEDFDHKIIDAFIQSGQPGILSAFKGTPEMRGTNIQAAFYLKSDQSFKADFMIGNYTDNPIEYLLIVLIDYKQQRFLFNHNLGFNHSVRINPKERMTYPLEVEIGKGAHDFLLLGIKKMEVSEEAEVIDYLFHRANIYAGSTSFQKVSYGRFPQQQSEYASSLIFIKRPMEVDRVIESMNRQLPSKASKYYIYIGNPYQNLLSSALVLFSDSSQTFFRIPHRDDYMDVLYPVLDPENTSLVEVRTFFESRSESLWAINVENPYVHLESEPGVMTQLPTYVKISNILRFQK